MKRGFLFLGIASAFASTGVVAEEDNSKFYAGAGFGIVKIPTEEGIKFSDANNGSIQFGYKVTENIAIEAQYSKSTKDASAHYAEEGTDVSDIWWDSVKSMNPDISYSQIQSWYPFALADVAMNFEANIETTGIYVAYRSTGDLYFKLKAGYVSQKAELSVVVDSMDLYVAVANDNPIEVTIDGKDVSEFGFAGKQSVSERESDFSAGIGAGYKFTKNIFSELEFTRLGDDLDFYSVSINYAF